MKRTKSIVSIAMVCLLTFSIMTFQVSAAQTSTTTNREIINIFITEADVGVTMWLGYEFIPDDDPSAIYDPAPSYGEVGWSKYGTYYIPRVYTDDVFVVQIPNRPAYEFHVYTSEDNREIVDLYINPDDYRGPGLWLNDIPDEYATYDPAPSHGVAGWSKYGTYYRPFGYVDDVFVVHFPGNPGLPAYEVHVYTT